MSAPTPSRLAVTRGVKTVLRLCLADKLFVIEALMSLIVASVAIRLLPFKKVAAAASRPPAGRSLSGSRQSDVDPKLIYSRVRWAIQSWARRVPWRAVCFQQGLAAQAMLSRRGIASTLYYGIAKDEARGLLAHVWVKVAEANVIGCENLNDYSVLASFSGHKNTIKKSNTASTGGTL